ncbi:MAG: MFS transporter [Nitrospinaceae bacterium]
MTPPPNKLVIASWSLYDSAGTIFSMNVISLYFALWVTVDKGGEDILYSAALSGSMLAVALTAPMFGAISDQTGRRRAPLIILTLICVTSTASIGKTDHLFTGLLLFVVANYCYQSAIVFYNAMLPSVARGSSVGMVSGYGAALGYLGAVAGLMMVRPFVNAGGRPAAFVPTALMFLIFALPCFFFVKDPDPKPLRQIRIGEAFRTLKQTVINTPRYGVFLKFILIYFLTVDAINTVIAFMAIYANKVIGFDDGQITRFLISSTFAAMVGSYVIGWLVKKRGTVWSYWLVLWLWFSALLIAAVSQTETMFWVVGPLAGIGMGGVWVVSRAILVELAPPEKVGEFFGIYGLAGKMASILGPLLWGSIVWLLEDTQTLKYRAAVSSLLLIIGITLLLFRSLAKQIPQNNPSQQT